MGNKMVSVLVIDDNAILLRTVKEMLSTNYNVSIATSCTQAFAAIEKNIPDIILLDYEMPIIDGEGVLVRLRERSDTKHIPVIFFTGSADRDVVTRLLALNPDGYLLKPPSKEKMVAKIEKVLSGE